MVKNFVGEDKVRAMVEENVREDDCRSEPVRIVLELFSALTGMR